MVPEDVSPSIVYNKLKDDVFKRAGSISSIKSEDALKLAITNIYNISFENGSSPKYTNMQKTVRDRFDRRQWWSLKEVLALRAENVGSNSVQARSTEEQGGP